MKLENYRPVRPADADPESVQHSRLPRNPVILVPYVLHMIVTQFDTKEK